MAHLKVLFLTAWYPSQEQPLNGIFVREHAKAVQLYSDVCVLHCAGWGANLKTRWQVVQENDPKLTEGIPTYALRYRVSPLPKTSVLIQYWSILKAFQQIYQTGFRPAIIHAHVYQVALPAVLIGKLYKIPVVVSEHNSVFPRKLISKADTYVAKIAFRAAARVLPVSRALQKGIEANNIQANFQIIPNVVDIDLFQPAQRQRCSTGLKKLLCVANMPETHVKGIPYLLSALAQLPPHLQWQIEMIGDGPMRSLYMHEVHQLGLDSKVHFLGYRTRYEIAQRMQEADLFVLPSVWDNMPCVLIEAMASGLPVLSTLTGGIPEMIDTETGVLVKPGNAEELSLALVKILSNLAHYDPTVIAQKARRYSYAAVGAEIQTIYESCLS